MCDYLSKDLYESIMDDVNEAYENKDIERLKELRDEVESYRDSGNDSESGTAKTLTLKR